MQVYEFGMVDKEIDQGLSIDLDDLRRLARVVNGEV